MKYDINHVFILAIYIFKRTEDQLIGSLILMNKLYRLGDSIVGILDLTLATVNVLQVRCSWDVYSRKEHH
jgi:hypothetical protein